MLHPQSIRAEALWATEPSVLDEGFGREMDAVFAKDLEQAKEYKTEDFENSAGCNPG